MTRAVTTDSLPGDALSAATENTKLSNCGTATQNIDDANVRDEGVDSRNLGDYPAHVTMQNQDNDSTTPATYRSGWDIGGGALGADARQELTHDSGIRLDLSGSPVTVQAGDLVVIEWQVLKWQIPMPWPLPHYYDEGWVLQGYWDITSVALTDFETLAGGPEFGNPFNILRQLFSDSEDISVIPRVVRVDPAGAADDYASARHSSRGYWFYEHSGPDLTIYGITLMLSGVYRTYYSPVSGNHFMPMLYDQDIEIERAQLSIQVYRK